MNKLEDLIQKENKLIEELQVKENEFKKVKQILETTSKQVKELKEQRDYGSFKFILSNVGIILQKLAPKHKIPIDRNINISNENETQMSINVPWANEECSDSNPCNSGVCARCTILNFKEVMTRLLSGYYVK